MKQMTPALLSAAARCDKPTYLYDLSKLMRQCETIENIGVPNKRVFFASMANDHPAILAAIRHRGHGVFVNSPRHLRLAHSLGFDPDRIIYAASNMTIEEMDECCAGGVHLVLDSVSQIEQLSRVKNRPRAIGLRVNVGSSLDAGSLAIDPTYRFGILAGEITAALERAAMVGVVIRGVHCYFGTDIVDAKILLQGLRWLCEAAVHFPNLTYIDVGGGFSHSAIRGVSFDFSEYGRDASSLLSSLSLRLGRPITMFIEPGRFLAATSGVFVVSVVDIKQRADRTFVGTNGSIALFPRPLFYPDKAAHPCLLLADMTESAHHDRPIDVCGNSTYSRDFLARGLRMALPRVGDRLAFLDAGAYCRSMITEFLGKDRPREIVMPQEPESGEAELCLIVNA